LEQVGIFYASELVFFTMTTQFFLPWGKSVSNMLSNKTCTAN